MEYQPIDPQKFNHISTSAFCIVKAWEKFEDNGILRYRLTCTRHLSDVFPPLEASITVSELFPYDIWDHDGYSKLLNKIRHDLDAECEKVSPGSTRRWNP